uniref:Tyrosine-protein phosphatase domain-containing protein n=1 Tax=Parastrongyloides trichosuri TaxID=131310 RepID=A0A0N4Z5Z0_PARTI
MIISSIKPISRMLLILWMVATVGCSLFPSAPSGVTNTEISYELRHNSSSDVIMVKCPGSNFKYETLSGNFVYDNNLHSNIGFKESDDKTYVWMAWKKEDISVSNLNVKCGSYDYNVGGTVDFKKLFWNIKLISTSTTKFLESVNLLSSFDARGDSMKDNTKCGKSNNDLNIISKDRNGILSSVEMIKSEDMQAKMMYYFFYKDTIIKDKEFITPCGIIEVYDHPPKIKIAVYKLIKASEDDKVKITDPIKSEVKKYFFTLEGNEMKDFYKGEKVLIKKMVYHNGKAEIKEEKGIEASESFLVTDYEILEISYRSLFKDRMYEDVKEVIFFGPVNKSMELKMEVIKITAADVPYQLSCSYTKFSYAYLYQVKANTEVIDVKELTTDGAVLRGFTRSGDLVMYKPVNVDKMDWVCIYKTPNGKVVAPYILVRGDRFNVQDDDKEGVVVAPINKISPPSEPSFIDKMIDRLGAPFFYVLVVFTVLLILLVLFLILFLVFRNKMKYYFAVAEKRKKYPNIMKFWINVKTQTIGKYSNIATEETYIPSKVKDIKVIKHVASDDAAVEHVTSLFDDTLIDCFKDIDGQIKAYYVQDVSPRRKYIISEGPRKESTKNFFKMLYLEDVEVVVAIVFRDNNDFKKTKKDICYWPDKPVMFGSLSIEPLSLPDTSSASKIELTFRMKLKGKPWKNLTIIHVPDWREFELPSTTLSLIELYKKVDEYAGSRNVLIHNSHAVGPRVFIVTYFFCIFETIIKDKSLSNPMVVLKKIREKCFGGQVTPREFGFIIYSVLKHLFNCKYLVDKESAWFKFTNDFETFMYETRIVEADESNYLSQMMRFLAATNKGKMMDIIKQSQAIQTFDLNTLKAKCKRQLDVLKNKAMNKIRYPNVYCLDCTAISNGKRRKLILCQAPIPDTFDDMLDMIYRNRVGIIVLLVNPEERKGPNSKWSPYFPVESNQIFTKSYIVNKKSGKPVDEYNISETNYAVAVKANTSSYSCFKIYHYVAWPDKSVPTSTKGVLELCKRVMKDGDSTRDIVIHCSAGIGRTGTFALIMLLIDTVLCSGKFNPLKSLDFLRRHRHRAVQTDAQFAFAIATVVDYFKKDLKNINEGVVVEFENMLNKIYK